MAGTGDRRKGPASEFGPALSPPGWKPKTYDPTVVGDERFKGVDTSHVLKVAIWVDRGNGWIEFPLWLKTDVTDMPDFAVVESATIEWGPTITGRMTVTLKMDFQMGKWFLDSELSRHMNVLTVQAGYPVADSWTPIFFGYMDVPQPSHDPMGYQVTLSANVIGNRVLRMRYDMSRILTLGSPREVGARPPPVPATTRREVIRSFLESQGFDVYFMYDLAKNKDEGNSWMDDTVQGWWPQEQDIFSFIEWICREAGMRCVMWPNSETGYVYAFTFMNISTIYRQEVAKELVLFGNVNLDKNIYPLTNFASDSPVVFMDRWAMGASAADIDPDTNKLVTAEANEGTMDVPALDEESILTRASEATSFASEKLKEALSEESLEGLALEALEGSGRQDPFTPAGKKGKAQVYEPSIEEAPSGVQIAAPVGRDQTEKGLMESVYKESALGSGIQAQLQSIGMPDAYPQMQVNVRRVGARFDGKYIVRRVIHNIGTVWDTTLEGIREGFPKGSGLLKSTRPLLPKETKGDGFGGPYFDLPVTKEAGDIGAEAGVDVTVEGAE